MRSSAARRRAAKSAAGPSDAARAASLLATSAARCAIAASRRAKSSDRAAGGRCVGARWGGRGGCRNTGGGPVLCVGCGLLGTGGPRFVVVAWLSGRRGAAYVLALLEGMTIRIFVLSSSPLRLGYSYFKARSPGPGRGCYTCARELGLSKREEQIERRLLRLSWLRNGRSELVSS